MAAAAGLIGGLSLSVFWQPEQIRQHGSLVAGGIVGGISVGSSFVLTGIICRQLGMDIQDVDTTMGVGFILGIAVIAVTNFIANFFAAREKKDIFEVAAELRNKTKGIEQRPPVQRDRR
jgi:hypothetical protein